MKRMFLLIFSFLLISVFSSQAFSQLINYGRRNRFIGTSTPADSLPSWAKDLPKPQNDEERRYDINGDGLLQSAEIKVYLRAIIERVEGRGYVNVTTDLLREYDKNKDGIINENELVLMKEHIK